MTVRCGTEPVFGIDCALMGRFIEDEKRRKAKLLARVEQDKSMLMSNDKFATLLIELGVDPPMKVSAALVKSAEKKGESYAEEDVLTYAFAKSDPGMQALLEHEDDAVRFLVEARVGVKSTLNETRAGRMLGMGQRGAASIYLKYHGAHTTRFAGGDRLNWQNLPRGGTLRKAIIAPPGMKFVVSDSSQIEARVNAWVAEHETLLDLFRQGDVDKDFDIYGVTGSELFGQTISKKTHPLERQVAKNLCIGEGTLVLTEGGWCPIERVGSARVWDGVEWVDHRGVVFQGEQETWETHSVAATPDHAVLTERGWREWSAVLTSPSLFQSALDSASSPSSTGSSGSPQQPDGRWAGNPICRCDEPGNLRFATRSANMLNRRHVGDMQERIQRLEEENADLRLALRRAEESLHRMVVAWASGRP